MCTSNDGGICCIIREYFLITQRVLSHDLMEHMFTLTRGEAAEWLDRLLKGHNHGWHMWISYKDTVVVVNMVEEGHEERVLPELGTAGLRR